MPRLRGISREIFEVITRNMERFPRGEEAAWLTIAQIRGQLGVPRSVVTIKSHLVSLMEENPPLIVGMKGRNGASAFVTRDWFFQHQNSHPSLPYRAYRNSPNSPWQFNRQVKADVLAERAQQSPFPSGNRDVRPGTPVGHPPRPEASPVPVPTPPAGIVELPKGRIQPEAISPTPASWKVGNNLSWNASAPLRNIQLDDGRSLHSLFSEHRYLSPEDVQEIQRKVRAFREELIREMTERARVSKENGPQSLRDALLSKLRQRGIKT